MFSAPRGAWNLLAFYPTTWPSALLPASTHTHTCKTSRATSWLTKWELFSIFLSGLLVVVYTVDLSVKLPSWGGGGGHRDTSSTFLLASSALPSSSLTGFLGFCSALRSNDFVYLPWAISSISTASATISLGWFPINISCLHLSPGSQTVIHLLQAPLHTGDAKAPKGRTYPLPSPSVKATTCHRALVPGFPPPTCNPKSVTRSCLSSLLVFLGIPPSISSVIP